MKKVILLLSISSVLAEGKLMKQNNTKFSLTSAAFGYQSTIPAVYTCDGDNYSPALSWSGFPEKTKSFSLICDDPDAHGIVFVHWVLFNIPGDVTRLEEKKAGQEPGVYGALQGMNDFKRLGYGGPCPPQGEHRYFFKLYALDTMLNLPVGVTKEKVEQAMKGHILASTELVGLYKRMHP
jgi:Raf kinase inhibitor-like YbhB/YbcL family protein